MTRRVWLAAAAALLAQAKSRITRARVTAFTDEIGVTQTDAIDLARHYGLQWVQLRAIPGTTRLFTALTDPEMKRYEAELGLAKLKIASPDVAVRIDIAEPRDWKTFFEKLQRDNYSGLISLQTTPARADDAMRQLMRIIGDL